MVTPAIIDFWIFHFFLSWYERACQCISKQYNFIQWFSFSLQIFNFKTWKNKAASHKIYWDNHFFQKSPQPLPSINADGSANYTETLLWTNYWSTLLIQWRGRGVLMELSLSFLRENPNKLCFIELSQKFCDWL